MMEVASSIGLMIEVDWQGLFNSFFSLVRVKLQCKDPTKIPKKRIFVFKSNLYVIEFNAEGHDQTEVGLDDDLGKFGEGKTKEGGPPEEDGKKGPGNDADPDVEGSKKKDEVGNNSATEVNKKGSASVSKSVKRALLFEDEEVYQHMATIECVSLLKAMELEDGDDMDEDKEDSGEAGIKEDEELSELPEEWVFDFQELAKEGMSKSVDNDEQETVQATQNLLGGRDADFPQLSQSQGTADQLTQPSLDVVTEATMKKDKKKGGKQRWGPVMPLRRSTRNLDTGKTMLEKAIEAKKKWDLEDKAGMKNCKPSKSQILSIAKDIVLEVLDGYPSVADKMLELDDSRTAASKKVCS